MKKRAYRKTAINKFCPEEKLAGLKPQELVLAIDVAKHDMVAALTTKTAEVLVTLSWKHPAEAAVLLRKLDELRLLGHDVEAVMESTGRYGDILRQQLRQVGIVVYQVSAKRVHDSMVVHDGVASLHDAKSAAIIAELHGKKRSALWPQKTDETRALKASVSMMDLHQAQHLRLVNQLESELARYWPELTEYLELTSATLLSLLATIGGPADVVSNRQASLKLMKGTSRGLLSADKLEAVLRSAESTVGLEPLAKEREALMMLASEAYRSLREYKKAKLLLEKLAAGGASKALSGVLGKTTAAVVVSEAGEPKKYSSAGAYLKAFGLNLKEKSSGKYQGQLSITKNGSGRARQYMWLAVGRLLQKDPLMRAWYEAKVKRDGGRKRRAMVGLIRKLVKALFWVGRGEAFDSRKLFDAKRLNLA